MKFKRKLTIFVDTIKKHQQFKNAFYIKKARLWRSWLNPRLAFIYFLQKNEIRYKTSSWPPRFRYDSIVVELSFIIGFIYAVLFIIFIRIIGINLLIASMFKSFHEFGMALIGSMLF